jgi:ATP-dependent DNA helicase RecG
MEPGAVAATAHARGAPHPACSIPHNPPSLARYIEMAGTGTPDMIDLRERAGLPSPTFRQEGGQFIQVLWRPGYEGTKMDLDQESVEVVRA